MVSTASRNPPTRAVVRIGVVGLGAVAQAVHLPLIDRLPDRFALTALCDLSPRLLAALGDRYGVPREARFSDADALFASRAVDAVLILSSGSHGTVAAAALSAGLDVLCEKPLASTLAEADALAALAGAGARSGPRLQLGYMKLYDPAVVAAQRWMDARASSGTATALRSIEVTVLHPPSGPQLAHARLLPPPTDIPAAVLATIASETERLTEAALGTAPDELKRVYANVLLGSVVHELALIRRFGGDPIAIDDVDTWPPGAWPPSVSLTGRLDRSARFAIRWHYLEGFPAYREEVRLVFDDAVVELLFPSPYLLHAPTRLTITDSDGGAFRDTSRGSYAEAFEEQLLAFHELVVDGTPPAAGIVEGRADIVTCQLMARRLAERNGWSIGGEAAADAPARG
jgi:myo-inositol 2-dehydrogenase/D-chiro-inositol 1-dehydrogenase